MTKRMKHGLLTALTIFAAMMHAGAVQVGDYRFHKMPETSYYGGINSITKDVYGRIWFTGTDALYMYDGVSYRSVALPNPMPLRQMDFRTVRSMPDGSLFVSTNVGLYSYDFKKQEFLLEYSGSVGALETEYEDQVWMMVNDTLSRFKGEGILEQYVFPDEISSLSGTYSCHTTSSAIYVSADTDLYVCNHRDGSFRYFGSFPQKGASGNIADVMDIDSLVYVLTERGDLFECRQDGTVLHRHHEIPADSKAPIAKQLYADSNGVIWVATQAGLLLYDRKSSEVAHLRSDLRNPFSLPNDSVWSIFPDPVSGVWIGTYGGKLAFQTFDDDEYAVVTPPAADLANPIVSAFAEDDNHRVWIGTEGGGISCYDLSSGRFIDFDPVVRAKLSKVMVKNLKFVDGKLYIAAFNAGVMCYDLSAGRLVSLGINDPATGKPMTVYDFEFDADRGLWLSDPDTDLRYWDRATSRVEKVMGFDARSNPVRLRVQTMFRDGTDMFLVTSTGVIVMDTASRLIRRRYWIESDDNRPNNLCSYCRTSSSEIWFGTRGAGVTRLKQDGTYAIVTGADGKGLDGLNVFSIEEDASNGDMWFSTEDGLYIYRQASSLFEKAEIGANNECGAYYIRSGAATSSNVLMFGGTNGFIVFSPDAINRNKCRPRVFFTEFKVNNEVISLSDRKSPLKQSIMTMDGMQGRKNSIHLSHRQTNFEVDFSSDSYLEHHRNRFAYRLIGMSDSWTILPQNQNFVQFLNVRPGRYMLEVKASNNVGLWSDSASSVSIIIHPSPFLSIFAYIIYISLFILAIWMIWAYTTKRKMLEQQLQVEMEKEQNLQELDRARNEFFTNISHDLKTPLTLVIDPLKQLERQIPKDAPYRDLVTLIWRNVSRIQRMLSQLLQFRKIETIKSPEKKLPGDIVRFVDSVFSLFEFYASKKQIETEFKSWVDNCLTMFDHEIIEKIFTNLFSNAIKYTTENGYVGVKITPCEEVPDPSVANVQWISFSVTNTGSEIPASKYKTIFEPFNNEGKTKLEFESHTGLGLAIVQKLVEDQHGTITVSSADNMVCFTVVLPFEQCGSPLSLQADRGTEQLYDYASSEIDAMISEIEDNDAGDSSRGRKTYDILIVEDDSQLRAYLESRISRFYNVYTAVDGNDGIAKAGKILPQIIVTDLLMPQKDGFAFCKEIRSDIKTSHIPIIALSATGENTSFKIDALESGANVFIDKPVDMDYLLKQIANLIKNQNRLKELFSKRYVAEPSNITTNSVDEEFMKKAVAFIESNFENENYGVDDFASDMAMGRTRLYQKLNDLTGMSIKEFILDIRLKRAGQLLRDTEYNVAEISTMTGFASPKYFSVCFKRHFGQSPTEFKASVSSPESR